MMNPKSYSQGVVLCGLFCYIVGWTHYLQGGAPTVTSWFITPIKSNWQVIAVCIIIHRAILFRSSTFQGFPKAKALDRRFSFFLLFLRDAQRTWNEPSIRTQHKTTELLGNRWRNTLTQTVYNCDRFDQVLFMQPPKAEQRKCNPTS